MILAFFNVFIFNQYVKNNIDSFLYFKIHMETMLDEAIWHTGSVVIISWFVICIVPGIIYMHKVRNSEKEDPEPWGAVYMVFLWGVIASLILSISVQYGTDGNINLNHLQSFGREYVFREISSNQTFTLSIVALFFAPLLEEIIKSMGFLTVRKYLAAEVENSIVYGAAIGLGFAAMDNIIYEAALFIQYGVQISLTSYLWTVIIRSITVSFVQASTTALLGYGLGIVLAAEGKKRLILKFFGYALLVHMTYNYFIQADMYYEKAIYGVTFGILLAYASMKYVRFRIRDLDARRDPLFGM